jgi:hypothetical protein
MTSETMRTHLPRNILSLTVTRPLFAALCRLDEHGLFGKPFWRRLQRARDLASGRPA